MGILSDKKLRFLQSDYSNSLWYITKQNCNFRDLAMMARILEMWNNDDTESFQHYFDRIKVTTPFNAYIGNTPHRALKNCEFYGLMKPSGAKAKTAYTSSNLTDVYKAVKQKCSGQFQYIEKYQDIIDKQLEDMKINVNGKDINPIMFALKVILTLGDITGTYRVQNNEFKLFICTCNEWSQFFQSVESIIRFRNDSNFKQECLKNYVIANDTRFNLVFDNLSYVSVEGKELVVPEENISIVRRKVAEFELGGSIYSDSNGLVLQNSNPIKPVYKSVDLFDDEYSYISAIKAKPFLILGGFSGTGKSIEVKKLAFATCHCDGVLNTNETSPGNYLLLSVKPNWHDATDITGFRSSVQNKYYVTDFMRFLLKAKMYEDLKVPFFVCLDEMNLAPVEEYFADFLSVIESRKRRKDGKIVTDPIVPASVFTEKYAADYNIFMDMGLKPVAEELKPDDIEANEQDGHTDNFERQDIVDELKSVGLTIPQNVVIIGTVNMDDTTNTFSRKVIDRAMTFETIVQKFGESYFDSDIALHYVENPRKGELFISDEVRATEMLTDGRYSLTDGEEKKILDFVNHVNEDLEGTPFKISYRILNETILLYRAKREIANIMEKEGDFEKDVTFNTDLNTIFDDILMQKVLPRIEGDYEKCNKCLENLLNRCNAEGWTQSMKKIDFMKNRFGGAHTGFTSFWN